MNEKEWHISANAFLVTVQLNSALKELLSSAYLSCKGCTGKPPLPGGAGWVQRSGQRCPEPLPTQFDMNDA